jgi:hypothetical protein
MAYKKTPEHLAKIAEANRGKKLSPEAIAKRTATRRARGNYDSHGHGAQGRRTPTYFSWMNMIQRCENPKNSHYTYYGGRGIYVCNRWQGLDGFKNFLQDMGERPEGMTLDRINNDGPYELSNCRWADKETQMLNRRRSTYYDRGSRESICHPDRAHKSKGMCASCYRAFREGRIAKAILGTAFEAEVRRMLVEKTQR